MIRTRLANYRAVKDSDRHKLLRSSVAIVLDSDDLQNASVLMIERATREGDPWSGHMAFPGGRRELSDVSSLQTAKREMFEEVGLNIDLVNSHKDDSGLIARLSDQSATRRLIEYSMVISPYVFLVDRRPDLTINYEVADFSWIPLQYFADLNNRRHRKLVPEHTDQALPCYEYSDKKIVWGLSLAMIDDLLRGLGFDVSAGSNG